MTNVKNECNHCGTCCTKGGPALHSEDLKLLETGVIERGNLITIRKGELVFKPLRDEPQAAKVEIVKICGIGRDWQCYFYEDEKTGCTIYEDRPLSCRELECWNTDKIERLVEHNTLTRLDIIGGDEPVITFIKEHSEHCPCPDMHGMYRAVMEKKFPQDGAFDALINKDLEIRTTAVKTLNVTVAEELFYFGRPVFQLLQQLGGRVEEKGGRLHLSWPKIP